MKFSPRIPRSIQPELQRVRDISAESVEDFSASTDLITQDFSRNGWNEFRNSYQLCDIFYNYGVDLSLEFALLRSGCTVLDLGSGGLALAANEFQQQNPHLIFEGVTAPDGYRHVPRDSSQIEVHREEMLRFLMANPSTYDMIYSTYAVMYHPHPWLVLEAAFRALKPGGKMFIEGIRFPILIRKDNAPLLNSQGISEICDEYDLNYIMHRQLAGTDSRINFARQNNLIYPMFVNGFKSADTSTVARIKIPYSIEELHSKDKYAINSTFGHHVPLCWTSLGTPSYGYFVDYELVKDAPIRKRRRNRSNLEA